LFQNTFSARGIKLVAFLALTTLCLPHVGAEPRAKRAPCESSSSLTVLMMLLYFELLTFEKITLAIVCTHHYFALFRQRALMYIYRHRIERWKNKKG
jgi:hypothetical protein